MPVFASRPRRARIALPLVLGLAVTGCVTPLTLPTKTAGPALAPAALPSYTIGDSVTWNDKTTETVVAVNGRQITWEAQNGFSFISSANPILPRLSWAGKVARGSRTLSTTDTALFPLQNGNTAAFQALVAAQNTTTGQDMNRTYRWECSVDGTERLKTAVGVWDTWRTICYEGTTTTAFVRRYTTWYAPDLQGPVRVNKDTRRDATVVNEVTALKRGPDLPRPAAKAQGKALQQVLETAASDTPLTWTDPASGASGTVQATATFQRADQTWCRSYTTSAKIKDVITARTGQACRGKDGRWK